jgi:anti-sigma regulatory factor (Ser/Thr protein kinase)
MTSGDVPVSQPEAGPGHAPAAAQAGDGGTLLLEQGFGAGTLYGLRAAVLAHAVAAGMPENRARDVVIVVHELAANAIRHGAGRGRLRVWSRAGVLHCLVEDGARPGSPDGQDAGAGGRAGAGRNVAAGWPYAHGHGLWLVRLLADQLSIVSEAGGTRAAVRFAFPAAPGLAAAADRADVDARRRSSRGA